MRGGGDGARKNLGFTGGRILEAIPVEVQNGNTFAVQNGQVRSRVKERERAMDGRKKGKWLGIKSEASASIWLGLREFGRRF